MSRDLMPLAEARPAFFMPEGGANVMDLKSIPGSGRLAGTTKIITAGAVAVQALAAYLTGSEALWGLVQQLVPLVLAGG